MADMRGALGSGSNKSRPGPKTGGNEARFSVKQPILKDGLRGGVVTSKNKTLLPMGSFSMIQNMRPTHPGFKPRLGQTRQHVTADGTNQAMTLYQFSKGKKVERHVFAQMNDGDVLEATTAPPAVSPATFGSSIFAGTTGGSPASWSVIRDKLIFSNAADQHQIYPGESEYVDKVMIVKATEAIPKIPTKGEDATKNLVDGLTTTYATLSALADLANDYDCIFIKTAVRADAFNFVVKSANDATTIFELNYNNGAWTNVAITDGTAAAGVTLAASGAMTWASPSDEKPRYLFGENGWWYQLYIKSGDPDLGSSVEISSVTYEADFQDIANLWDGIAVDIIECQKYVYSATGGTYKNYSAALITLSEMTANDKGYFSSFDNIIGVYVDVGATPNTVETATVDDIRTWTGVAFESVSNIVDGTDGFTKSGWITWDLKTTAEQTQFNDLPYFAHWFYFTVDTTLGEDITVTMKTMPYFDITDIGTVGVCSTVWKDRGIYGYNDNILYVSGAGSPQVLSGIDSTTLEAGDGRSNRVLCMRKFHNELMVWQQEKGDEGGCLTLFQGYNPTTFGKLVLSTKTGIMNAKCAVVIDGSNFTTSTQANVQTIAFFLSRYGVFASSGTTVTGISDDIQNYFDPTKSECVRRGYEDQMWLAYDSSYHCLRLGLVSGSTATVPNIFPVYDLVDNVWSFDALTPALSCIAEVEAESGTSIIVPIGGGAADGYVYILNDDDDDEGTAIDAYITIELQAGGIPIQLNAAWLRVRAQEDGDITLTPYLNGVTDSDYVQTLDMEYPEKKEDYLIKRERLNFKAMKSTHISLKIGHNKADETFALEALMLDIDGYGERGM